MAKRPVALLLASLLFLYFPAELFARYYAGFELSLGEIAISGVAPVILVAALVRVTRVGWFTLIAFVALWGIRDLYLVAFARGGSMVALVGHLCVYGLSLGYFINPRVRTLYFDPKLCWWKSKKRYETFLPLLIEKNAQWQYPIAKNISEGGCFVDSVPLFSVGTEVQLAIPMPVPLSVPVVHTKGIVRWVLDTPTRKGMGIEFHETQPAHLKAVKEYVREQL
jgi:Tfp pilus assembly protein PilZ